MRTKYIIMVYILTDHNIMCSRGHVPHRLQTSALIFYTYILYCVSTYVKNMSQLIHHRLVGTAEAMSMTFGQ